MVSVTVLRQSEHAKSRCENYPARSGSKQFASVDGDDDEERNNAEVQGRGNEGNQGRRGPPGSVVPAAPAEKANLDARRERGRRHRRVSPTASPPSSVPVPEQRRARQFGSRFPLFLERRKRTEADSLLLLLLLLALNGDAGPASARLLGAAPWRPSSRA